MKEHIDKLFINGKIYTLEKEDAWVQAVGIDGGRFVYTGDVRTALAHYDADEIIDLEGKTVLPGMGDSHLHFYAYCQTLATVDLGLAQSKAEAMQMLADKAAQTPEGEWIRGSNFDQSKWHDCEDQLPTREDLDKISQKHPILIKRVCLHAAVANSMALKTAGIGQNYIYGEGGKAELDERGMPTGIIREQAISIFDDIIPDPMTIPAVRDKYMKMTFEKAVSMGLTMMHTYAAAIWNYSEDYNLYLALNRRGRLPVRMTITLDEMYEKPYVTPYERNDPYRAVQYGAFKIFCDGSLGARSAKLFEPYDDAPDTDGILVTSQEKMNRIMLEAYEKGLQPAIHCIGDKALECVLDAIEYTLETARSRGMTEREQKTRLPFRLIHVQMTHPEQIERMKRLPVILDVQPSFLCTDLHWIEERIGKARAKHSYQWKTMIDAGLMLTGSSDCPVESFSPWQGIFAAVTRKDIHGYPSEGYHPEEQVSVYDAVCMFSKNIPYANGEQDLMGTITEGKFADMVVIDRDIFQIPHDDILNIQVLRTEMAGETTYEK